MSPLVTIAIPTYQRLSYLKTAVEAALAQTYPYIEILISQDPTPTGLDPDIRAWCQTLLCEHPEVRYQANTYNLGLAGNWNAAADTAQGDYIVIIGDDDILLPTFVSTLIAAAQPDTQVIFSNHYIINSQGTRLVEESERWTQRYHRDQMPSGLILSPEIWVWKNAIPLLSSLIQTKIVQRLRFKEDLNTPEIELFLRLAKEDAQFAFVPDYLAEYRIHPQAATSSSRGLRIDRLVNYLLPLAVTPDIEPHKYACLSPLMINAVSHCLLDGQIKQAQTLIQSPYYPAWNNFQLDWLVQKICIRLSDRFGIELYKRLHAAKHTFPIKKG
jgi:glycosyltransferase involved in cell wall biosynthesis